MRPIRFSITFNDQLNTLLDYGLQRFGAVIAAEKQAIVYDTIEQFQVRHPAAKPPHPKLGLSVYPIRRTPFIVIYEFDDAELRVHFVLHEHADLADLDPAAATW